MEEILLFKRTPVTESCRVNERKEIKVKYFHIQLPPVVIV
jgi:hypothetical protein